MMALVTAMSMAKWFTALLFSGAAAAQSDVAPAHLDRVLRELAEGSGPLDGVRLETECLDEGRFVKGAAYGTRVAIWNDARQGMLTQQALLSLLEAFSREKFARMPIAFGEEEGDLSRMAIKMTCRVRFTGGGATKEVIQLDKGEQSAGLKRLARAIITATRTATHDAVPIDTLDRGLAAVADARLAVETLRITMRSGPGRGLQQADAGGWVLRLDGRDLEIEPDAGARTNRRLDAAAVREVARALRESGFTTLPSNVRAPEYVELTVSVLGKEHAVQARQFSGDSVQDAGIHARFVQAVAPLVALRHAPD
jgi:hypothetical protein